MDIVKKYDIKEITTRLNNLKKKFGSYEVDREIDWQSRYSYNWCDVLNLAYRSLKSKHTKIRRDRYGFVRPISFEIKHRNKLHEKMMANSFYTPNSYCEFFPFFNSSSTITTSNNYVW
jgi:hypothetical protein